MKASCALEKKATRLGCNWTVLHGGGDISAFHVALSARGFAVHRGARMAGSDWPKGHPIPYDIMQQKWGSWLEQGVGMGTAAACWGRDGHQPADGNCAVHHLYWKDTYYYNYYYFPLVFCLSMLYLSQSMSFTFFFSPLILSPVPLDMAIRKHLCGTSLPAQLNHNSILYCKIMCLFTENTTQ